ncbi:MAG: bifunctional metallophosphatase/5'-nucleotidase [Alphaproteobacteria bacterium]|nr:MAG: bifunctional metallophosphatase/5'-nucleotidase [Alphaproteobacteria bacterium]
MKSIRQMQHALAGLAAIATMGLLAGCVPQDAPAKVVLPGPSAPVAMIAVNDIYRIEGVDDSRRGGLGRIAWLRHRLEAETGQPVPLMHAGDALSPSLYSLSSVGGFAGEEMVDVLNLMDGKANVFDPIMYVAIGNHEFDNTYCQKKTGLKNFTDRVAQSGFTWLSGNLDYTDCKGGAGLENTAMSDTGIFVAGGIRFGVFGLTVDFEGDAPADSRKGPYIDPDYIANAKRLTAELRGKGAEYVIGVTHLDWACDVSVLATLGAEGPDLIMGGHDHVQMAHFAPTSPEPGQDFRAVYKASSDATDVAVYHFWRDGAGKVQYRYSPVDMDFRIPEDPTVLAAVEGWEQKLAAKACPADNLTCLETEVGNTAYEWQLAENVNRESETRIGNWFTDLMKTAAEDDGTFCAGNKGVVALINSGTFRLNYDISKGSLLRREHILSTMPFGAALSQLCLDGDTLRAALAQGLNAPGQGRYPHFAGMQVSYARTLAADADIRSLKVGDVDVPAGSKDRFIVVTGTYIAGGNDGYPFGAVTGDNRRDLTADLALMVPQHIAEQDQTPAISDANRRKIQLPSPVDDMVPSCSAGVPAH